jgi:hypothetical protein
VKARAKTREDQEACGLVRVVVAAAQPEKTITARRTVRSGWWRGLSGFCITPKREESNQGREGKKKKKKDSSWLSPLLEFFLDGKSKKNKPNRQTGMMARHRTEYMDKDDDTSLGSS